MINRFRNLKIVQKLEQVSPRFKWLMFSKAQEEQKSSTEFINMICSDATQNPISDNDKLEAMVRESLVKEFSPDVVNMKSYETLVDAVMHNIKKKQLQAMDNKNEIA